MPASAFACRCGALAGEIGAATTGETTLVLCHCRDCRSAYTHLGHADPGPVGILQTRQDRVRILRGEDRLRVFRHTPRGALRWYAACCDSPLFLTPLKPRLVHVGVNVDRLADPSTAGKVLAEAFIPTPDGGTRHRGMLRAVSRLISRILAANVDGAWRGTPFFDADGRPVRTPRVLMPAERAAALKKLDA